MIGENNIFLSFASASTLVGALLVSGAVLSADTAMADVIDDIAITVPVSCSFIGSPDTAHSATINAGTYTSDIGTTNFRVTCNDNAGYSIYAIGYSNNEFGNTNMLATINGTPSAAHNIATGTATSGSNSAWAMKLIPVTTASSGTTQPYVPTIESDGSGSFANYHAVPSEYTKVATFSSNTDATIGSNMQSTYQVYIDGTKPAGTYEGKVKYTMVHPASEVPVQPQTTQSGQICYYANATDAVGTMGCQNVASSVTLLASNFSRTGYGFAGWSDAFDYKTNANAHFYGPQETITLNTADYTGEGKGLSLYAVWVKSEGNLQDATKVASVCSSLTTAPTNGTANLSSVSAFTDQRDNNTYAIAKLADGKCWMIENLRLENTGTNNANGSLAQGYGGQFAGLADPETADKFSSTYSANSLYSNDGANNTTNIGTSNTAYRMPRYNNINTPTNAADRPQNPTTNGATNSTSNASMYSYGNYYSWAAAIADTTAYTTNNQSVENYSICPSGWHLPIGGRKANVDVSDFWKLSRATIGADPANFADDYFYYTGTPEGTDASNKMRAYPSNFVYSGYVRSGSVSNRGSYGSYWSSTAYSSLDAYYLYLYSSYVSPGTNVNNKYNGRTVRCVVSGA